MSKRYILLAFAMLGFGASISAQITITNASFPAVGDTLRYAFDLSPAGDPNSYITAPGGNQNWNFTNLKTQLTSTVIYRNPNTGLQTANFPGAELLVTGASNESYYNVTNNKVELLGYAGADPLNLGVNVLAKYAPPIVEQRAPLQFFDINQVSTGLLLPFSVADLPGTIVNQLPVRPDSLRIRIAINRLDVVDGWGNVAIPGGNYQVLREKRTTYREARLDAKVPPLGWLDITDVAIQSLGLTELGVDTTVAYHFFSNVAKETIAIITLDNSQSQVASVQYKANRLSTATTAINPMKLELLLFPNPASDKVNLRFNNMKPGRYFLKIFNTVGMEVGQETYQIPGKEFETAVDVIGLGAGIYWLNLIDNQGVVRITKHIVVVK